MGRTPCCSHEELKKGAWTVQEDQKLIAYIQKYGTGNWRILPHKAGLQRCGKSCRLRWFNYLRPGIKRGQLSQEEEHTIIRLHAVLGNRWSSIAKHLPMRTDNEIKNYWNSYLKKHLEEKKCLDPLSLKSIATTTSFSSDSEAITTIESSSIAINTVPSKSTTTTHHSQQGSSKSTSSSSSTNLLNKVARKIVGSGYLDAVKSSSSRQHVNNIDKVTKRVTEYKAGDNVMQCHSNSSSASARLLNKMATSLSHRVQCHEAARSVFSKFIMGGCEKSETNDQVGSFLLDHTIASSFEDAPHIISTIGSSPSCFSEDNNTSNNEDNWQCVNSISFGNCGGGESSVSEVNLVSSDTGKCYTESSNSTTSCFLDEDAAAAASFNDELIEILRYEDLINMYI